MFTSEERTLLFALRSKCYEAKNNFKTLYKSDPSCRLGCIEAESQEHIFTKCKSLQLTMCEEPDKYNGIFENVDQQKNTVKVFVKIDEARNVAMKRLSGDTNARTLASPRTMQQTCL